MNTLLAAALFSQLLVGMPASDTQTSAVALHFCPQYLVGACVIKRDGVASIVWTNPCFARERGWRIVPMRYCNR